MVKIRETNLTIFRLLHILPIRLKFTFCQKFVGKMSDFSLIGKMCIGKMSKKVFFPFIFIHTLLRVKEKLNTPLSYFYTLFPQNFFSAKFKQA